MKLKALIFYSEIQATFEGRWGGGVGGGVGKGVIN